MRRFLFLLSLTTGFMVNAFGQTLYHLTEMIPESQSFARETVYGEISLEDEYVVKIFNTTSNDVFLFSSYLDECYVRSEYLHLYSRKKNTCIVSFLPLPYFLSYTRSDRLILWENAVVNKHQILYDFWKIPKGSYIQIKLPLNCFDSEYVKWYDAKEMDLIYPPVFKKMRKRPDCANKEIQFAIYPESDFRNRYTFYADSYLFFKEIMDYSILSIEVNRKDCGGR